MSPLFSAFKEGLWCLGFDLGKYHKDVLSTCLISFFSDPLILYILYLIYSQILNIKIFLLSSLGGARRHGGQFSNLREDKENIPHEVTLRKKTMKEKGERWIDGREICVLRNEKMYLCQEVVMNILDSQIGLEIQRISVFLHLKV